MSLGIGGWAYLILEDERTAKYKYGSFDWNNPKHYNNDKICDGQITIHKDLFSKFSDSSQWFEKKLIEIVNCSNCWAITPGKYEIDTIAFCLICKISKEYGISNSFPEKCSLCK